MLPYWFLFLVFALGAINARSRFMPATAGHLQVARPMRADATPLMLAALVPIIMIGFRYEVGGDWLNYLGIYRGLSYIGLWDAIRSQEPGYVAFNKLAHALGVGIWLVNFLCGLIFTIGLVSFARRQPNPWLAIVVAVPFLVIGVAMGYTRQATAIGCVMLGFVAISKNSFFRFVFWVMVGALFHRTAVVMLPIVALSYSRNRVQTILLASVAAVIGYYTLIAPAVERFTVGYIDQTYESEGAAVRLAMNVVPAIIFLLFQNRFVERGTERSTWRNISLIALASVVAYFLIESSVITDRLALYIIPLQMFVFARLPFAFGYKGRASGAVTILVLLYSALVQFVWLNYANNAEFWVPYKFYPLA